MAVILLSCLFHSSMARAHPHIFTHASVLVSFDESGLAGFKVNWMFDEMFTAMMMLDYDTNGNGKLESAEGELVKKNAFDPIREYSYFTHVKIGNTPFPVKYITDFSSEIIKNKLIYRFFIPCHVHAVDTFKEVKVSIYDKAFYTYFSLISQPVGFEGDEKVCVDFRVEKNRDDAYYFDQICPEEICLKFKYK